MTALDRLSVIQKWGWQYIIYMLYSTEVMLPIIFMKQY